MSTDPILTLEAEEFIRLSGTRPVVDVRTPDEFAAGHIPGAMNLPLFSNEERALIGTAYAKSGREQATRMGLDLIGPRMNQMLDDLKAHIPGGQVLVHCWRGGMRSESVAWLLNFSDAFQASTLRGGYKAFRRFALDQFATRRQIVILGGMTGSGKTHVLADLQRLGEQVVDLEGLANHKGSAFGAIGLSDQPTQQQFENELAVALSETQPDRRLWLEDESRRIGRSTLPLDLWTSMREAPCVVLEKSKAVRRAHLVADYGRADRDALVGAIMRIERRLGSEGASKAAQSVKSDDLGTACDILLAYYDKTYTYGLSKRDAAKVHRFPTVDIPSEGIASRLIDFADSTLHMIQDQNKIEDREVV